MVGHTCSYMYAWWCRFRVAMTAQAHWFTTPSAGGTSRWTSAVAMKDAPPIALVSLLLHCLSDWYVSHVGTSKISQ